MGDQERQWYTCIIYYYARDMHDKLILDCISPALESVEHAHSGFFFDRGWYLGPHVRVTVSASLQSWSEYIRPALQEHISAHLSQNPSTGCPDLEKEMNQHRKLAELEHVEGPLLPWRPDHSVRFGTRQDRSWYVGGNAVLDFLDDFHAEAGPLVLRALDRARSQGRRQELCLCLMFALAHTQCPPVSRGFLSYHSHAEAFLANCADPQRTRAAFEERHRANKERSAQILEQILRADGPAGAGSVPDLPEWIDLWNTYNARAHRLLESGQVDFDAADAASAQDARTSGFLDDLRERGEWDRIRTAAWFRCYRLLLNATYAQLTRLGVSPLERYLLCYTAARTVEEVVGAAAPTSAASRGSVGL